MSKNFEPIRGFADAPRANRYITKANNTAINIGDMVIQGTGGDEEYVTGIANGASNTATYVGVAASEDTVTATVDGEVYVWDDPNYTFRGDAATPGNLADTILNTRVTFDVSAGVETVDENDTSNGVALIVGYDSDKGTVDFKIPVQYHLSN